MYVDTDTFYPIGSVVFQGPDADHSPHVVPRSRTSRSYTIPSSQAPQWSVAGQILSLHEMKTHPNVCAKATYVSPFMFI